MRHSENSQCTIPFPWNGGKVKKDFLVAIVQLNGAIAGLIVEGLNTAVFNGQPIFAELGCAIGPRLLRDTNFCDVRGWYNFRTPLSLILVEAGQRRPPSLKVTRLQYGPL